jgi:hypothetical protein
MPKTKTQKRVEAIERLNTNVQFWKAKRTEMLSHVIKNNISKEECKNAGLDETVLYYLRKVKTNQETIKNTVAKLPDYLLRTNLYQPMYED